MMSHRAMSMVLIGETAAPLRPKRTLERYILCQSSSVLKGSSPRIRVAKCWSMIDLGAPVKVPALPTPVMPASVKTATRTRLMGPHHSVPRRSLSGKTDGGDTRLLFKVVGCGDHFMAL